MFRRDRIATGLSIREYLRQPLFIALLIGLPPAFITMAFLTTPDVPFIVGVPVEQGIRSVEMGMPELHGVIMAPMTAAFLAGMVGLFVMHSSREADRRLVMAGYPALRLLAVRLLVITILSLVVTAISVGVTFLDYVPERPLVFFLINLVAALQYGFLGAIVGTFLSTMAGTYLMFFAPMIDLGLVQNPMFVRESVDWWVKILPGYAPTEVLVDASFSSGIDTGPALIGALVYLAVLAVAATALFWQGTNTYRHSQLVPAGG